MTILYADDDRDDRELLIEALEVVNPSITCHHVDNGQQAIEQLRGDQCLPDYIFLDVNMPIMDGRTCLGILKRNERLSKIPVVIYSTTRDQDEINSLYALGATDFLLKPNSFEALCLSLNETINRLESRFHSNG